MSVLGVLGDFVCRSSYDNLPEDVVSCAKLRVLDTIGVLFSGYKYQFHRPLWETIGAYGGRREATVVGEGVKIPCALAALINSSMCDGMADGNRFAGLHQSVTVIPAALATLEAESRRRPLGGRDLILATTLGYEITVRIARSMMPSAIARGFEPTSVFGAFGAAAAAGKLLSLDQPQMRNALSIAAILGSGLDEAFNAPRTYVQIQEARAAESGVLAALFARNGAPGGSKNILERAFARAYSDHYSFDATARDLGHDYMITKTYDVIHYGCRHLHAPIDAVLHIVRSNSLAVEDIKRIEVKTYKLGVDLCVERPRDLQEAGMSMPFGIAVALVFGDASQDKFAVKYFEDKRVVELISRITVKHDHNLDIEYPAKRGTEVELTTRDGRTFRHKLDIARGEPETPFTKGELEDKFKHLTSDLIAESTRQRIISLIDSLERMEDLSGLIACLKAKRKR